MHLIFEGMTLGYLCMSLKKERVAIAAVVSLCCCKIQPAATAKHMLKLVKEVNSFVCSFVTPLPACRSYLQIIHHLLVVVDSTV